MYIFRCNRKHLPNLGKLNSITSKLTGLSYFDPDAVEDASFVIVCNQQDAELVAKTLQAQHIPFEKLDKVPQDVAQTFGYQTFQRTQDLFS